MQARRSFRIIVVCVVLLIADVISQRQLYEGQDCLLGDSGLYGECKKFSDCPGINVRVVNGPRPTLCSFEQKIAIVCCPIARSQLRVNNTAGTPAPPTAATPPDGVCTLRNGAQGQCKSVSECPRASISIRNGTQPIICRFDHNTPIVCCPTNNPATSATNRPPQRIPPNHNNNQRQTTQSTLETSSTVGAKSEAMCEYYSQFVFQFVESPVLYIIPQYYNESMCAVREHTPNQEPLRDAENTVPWEFPHVASLGYGPMNDTQWLCSGGLISERFILTTAHCITTPNNGEVRWARVGDYSPRVYSSNTPPTYTVDERIIHEGYRESLPYVNDIALVKLEKDVAFLGGIARPACLYTRPGNPPGHKFATAVGWGMSNWNDTTVTSELKKKDLRFVEESQCGSPRQRQKKSTRQDKSTKRRPDSSKICVFDASPVPSACVAEVGSPLQIVLDTPYCMHAIVGLTSFGARACADGTTPALYTRVSEHIAWIENHAWP